MPPFDQRMRELAEQVGSGPLVARVEVDQRYAEVQETHLEFKHPSGGQAEYLGSSLYDTADENCRGVADALLDRGPVDAMADAAERISAQVARRAPVDLFYLRQSGHPTVTDNGVTVYDRPPIQRRLTEAELDARGRRRR